VIQVGSQKTPKTIPEIKKQARLVQLGKRQRRELSNSPSDAHFERLLKGFETAVHGRAILMAENTALKAENKKIKRKREAKKQVIREKSSLTIQEGSNRAESLRMARQQVQEQVRGQEVLVEGQVSSVSKRALFKCSLCGEQGHRITSCSLRNN